MVYISVVKKTELAMTEFVLKSNFQPTGDQPQAIKELTNGINKGDKFQTLLGVTGSGKTFTIANVIANVNKPVLVISHNKTLAAQLYAEFKGFFPDNAVEYFISYYDYYQPEAYLPVTDTYIEKDTSINEEIDRLRLKATSSLLSRNDVIIVASVSCIYGLGSPKDFKDLLVFFEKGMKIDRYHVFKELIDIHYVRNDIDFHRGTFRVRGDTVEIFPAYEEHAIRLEMWGDEIEKISKIEPLTGKSQQVLKKIAIYPAKHFVTTRPMLEAAVKKIRIELDERLKYLRSKGKLLEAQRLESRTNYDIEMMLEVGYCSGIENYSRHLAGRKPGERPSCLIDYFPDDFLLVIDESHATIPQIKAMYNGDRARKTMLVEHGFRLPSALDNRPLKFDEFESMIRQAIFVSATPSDYELEKSGGVVVEQIIRPTGLMDPMIEIRPVENQVDDLIARINERVAKNERVLVTTLTKRMAEDLSEYLKGMGIKVRYMHSEIDALDRIEILRGLRLAEFDVLVGINLLREGLDLPEVSLVAILDADKMGFLRSERSLMQTAGRAARNVDGTVIFYADKMTDAICKVRDETNRRRMIQKKYNEKHNITPKTIYKSVDEIMSATAVADVGTDNISAYDSKSVLNLAPAEIEEVLDMLERDMMKAAENLDFEKAAKYRDMMAEIKSHRKINTGRYG